MKELLLDLLGREKPQLESTVFLHPLIGSEIITQRGKVACSFSGYGTFQWSSAVKSLTYLLLLGAAWGRLKERESLMPPRIEGERHSAAASLDYALGKQPHWLLDMFGISPRGDCYARRLIQRSNPERRRPGPVVLTLNINFLEPQNIFVRWEKERIEDAVVLGELANKVVQGTDFKIVPVTPLVIPSEIAA